MPILVVNCGSSSVKYVVFEDDASTRRAQGIVERIGEPGSAMLRHRRGGQEWKRAGEHPDHQSALEAVIGVLLERESGVLASLDELSVVGHRVVHGGERFRCSVIIDEEVVEAIRDFCALAPLHNPPNLAGIQALRRLAPATPQVAVFDTAFHATMPEWAFTYAVDPEWRARWGVRRYGFHGTSHQHLVQRAIEMLHASKRPAARLVTCHLGNGCSLAAVREGRCVETSMGFTPLEGLVMGTRSGNVDPAVVPFVAERLGIAGSEVVRRLNEEAGLLGLSGLSNDMRDLLAAATDGSAEAKLAIDVFCHRLVKFLGACVAVLGGIDAVVFSAGIGENCPEIRQRVCGALSFLGLHLDGRRNRDAAPDVDIATDASPVRALVIHTDEEGLIAREAAALTAVRD